MPELLLRVLFCQILMAGTLGESIIIIHSMLTFIFTEKYQRNKLAKQEKAADTCIVNKLRIIILYNVHFILFIDQIVVFKLIKIWLFVGLIKTVLLLHAFSP